MTNTKQTKQITVRLPEYLVDWLDGNLDEKYPTRAALLTKCVRRAKRRQESQQNLLQVLALRSTELAEDDDPDYLEWMRTRTFPDSDDEPARVLGSSVNT